MKTLQSVFSIILFAFPIVLTRSGSQVLTMISAADAGRLGAATLAEFGLLTAPYFTVTSIGMALQSGTGIAVARAKAQNEDLEVLASKILHFGAFLSLLGMVIWFLLFYLLFPSTASLNFVILLASVPAFIGGFLLSTVLEAFGKPQLATTVTAGGIGFNLFLNFLLVRLEIFQIQSATILFGMGLTRWLMLIALLVVFRFYVPFRWSFLSYQWNFIKDQMRFSTPIALTFGLRSAALSSFVLTCANYGESAVVMVTIIFQLLLIGTLFSRGVSAASIIKVARFQAMKQDLEIPNLIRSSMLAGTAFIVVLFLGIVFLPAVSFGAFTTDREIIANLVDLSWIIGFLLLTEAIANTLIGVLRPLGDRWFPQAFFGGLIFTAPFVMKVFSIESALTSLFVLLLVQGVGTVVVVTRSRRFLF